MDSSAVKVGVGVIVIILVCVSYYGWSPNSTDEEVDQTIAQMTEAYTCPSCDSDFNLTFAQVTKMRQLHGDIACPICGTLGAERCVASEAIDETASDDDDDISGDIEPESEPERNRPPRATESLRKKPRDTTRP